MIKDPGHRPGRVFKEGPVDDITPRHYGMCDIYRMFGDMVWVTIPATIVCKQRCHTVHFNRVTAECN